MLQNDDTRQNILYAAINIFSQKGFTSATLEEIAAEAKVTRGAIYWHFKNKHDIFSALHDELYKPMIEMIVNDMKITSDDPLDQLRNLCIQCLLGLANDELRKKAVQIFICKCDYSGMDDILQKQKEKKLQNIEFFSYYFERAKKVGKFQYDVCPKNLAIALTCYLSGIVVEYLRSELFDLETQAPILIEQFFASFKQS